MFHFNAIKLPSPIADWYFDRHTNTADMYAKRLVFNEFACGCRLVINAATVSTDLGYHRKPGIVALRYCTPGSSSLQTVEVSGVEL